MTKRMLSCRTCSGIGCSVKKTGPVTKHGVTVKQAGVTMLKAGGHAKKKQVLPKLELADFPKKNQTELVQESFPFIFPFHGHFGHTVFEQK